MLNMIEKMLRRTSKVEGPRALLISNFLTKLGIPKMTEEVKEKGIQEYIKDKRTFSIGSQKPGIIKDKQYVR